ncbi:MAG: hypothetical protein RL336_1411 [Pseudomonadota bacterium]|jgi:hypothetical protein
MKNSVAMILVVLAWWWVDMLDTPWVRLGRDGVCYTAEHPSYSDLRYYQSYPTLAACQREIPLTIAGR